MNPKSDYQKHLIIYVDDEIKCCKYFFETFGDKFSILTASNVDDGLRLFKENLGNVAILITEQRVQKENGIQLLDKVRQLDPRVMRILATAHSSLETAIDSVNTGAIYRYVTKPWNIPTLELLLKEAIENFVSKNSFNYKNHSVLFVDDEEKLRNHFALAFNEKFNVVTCQSADEALKLVKNEPTKFSVIMSDQRMPGLKGVQFLKATRSITPKAVRVLVTAYSDLETCIESINEGEIFKYITKPWAIPEIETVLLKCMEQYFLQNEQKVILELEKSPLDNLRLFLCHASDDKPAVRYLFKQLSKDGANVWFDEESLLPGQDWELEIHKAVRESDVIIVCLSRKAILKTGYVQKEIKTALDISDQQPEGTIYIIPVKLEDCEVPERIRRWHWVDYSQRDGYEKIKSALKERMRKINKK